MSDEELALEWMRQQAHKIDPYVENPTFDECAELLEPAFKKGKTIGQLKFLLGEADRRAGAAERKHAALIGAAEAVWKNRAASPTGHCTAASQAGRQSAP